VYIDAFAGSGQIKIAERKDALNVGDLDIADEPREMEEVRQFISGSARLAAEIDEKPFDRLVFVEKDANRARELEQLKREYPHRNIDIRHDDANKFLSGMTEDWRRWRGVLFLDPFSTEVEWSTIEKIASYNALDTWILFPVGAISRMLPKNKLPQDIDDGWARRLTKIYGDRSWEQLYSVDKGRLNLEIDDAYRRDPGINGLCKLYKDKLDRLFGKRYLDTSRVLKNSNNAVLYEFLFCVGNPSPAAIKIAKKIAKHLLDRLERWQ